MARTDPRCCSIAYEESKFCSAGVGRGGDWSEQWLYMTSGSRQIFGEGASSRLGFRLAITAQ